MRIGFAHSEVKYLYSPLDPGLTYVIPASLPRDQITFLFQKGTQEYEFFKLIWRHTDGVNIQLAASAITQAKVPTPAHVVA
jgi:hypothetical protein